MTKGRGSQSGCARRGPRTGSPLGRVRIVVRDRQSQTWWARVLSQSLTCFGPTRAFSHAEQRFVAGRVMVPWQILGRSLTLHSSTQVIRVTSEPSHVGSASLNNRRSGSLPRWEQSSILIFTRGTNPPLTAAFSAYERMSPP